LQVKDKRTLVETTVNSRFKAFRELRRVVHRKVSERAKRASLDEDENTSHY